MGYYSGSMIRELIEELDEYAEYLELDGQSRKSIAYSKVAERLRDVDYIPPNPCEINGVGEKTRDVITEFMESGEISELEELKDTHSYYENLREISGVGPNTARKLHDTLGVETVSELVERSNELTKVTGIGEKTARKITREAKKIERFNRE